MGVVALDGGKLIALMLAGGAFALAGLWLMFRPQPTGEAARFELFGLKVQASSAGLLVFLIGAVFLAMPVVVPEKPRALRAPSGGSGGGETAPVIPILVPEGGPEAEPNDHPRGANLIEVGKVYAGEVDVGERDYFRLAIEADRKQLRFIWRVLSSTGATPSGEYNPDLRCRLDVLNQNEVNLVGYAAPLRPGEARSEAIALRDLPAIFIKVEGTDGACSYEIETRYEDP